MSSDFGNIFDSSEELQITVKGPKTGREYSAPVWFVREGKTIFLLPLRGSDSPWYKNVHRSKRIKISSGKLSYNLTPLILTETNTVGSVIEKFRKKHGAGDIKKYYTVCDVALQLTLP